MPSTIDPDEILADILRDMPEKFRAGRGPVEARRAMHDAIAVQRRAGERISEKAAAALFDQLEKAILQCFGPQASAPEQKQRPEPHRNLEPAVDKESREESLRFIVADAFSAPVDGTPERAQVLANRARRAVRERLSREPMGFARRLSAMARAEQEIAAEAAKIGGAGAAPLWARLCVRLSTRP